MQLSFPFFTFFTSKALPAVAELTGDGIKPSTYTAPGAFPTSVYSEYYNNPTATSAQVQPGKFYHPITRHKYTQQAVNHVSSHIGPSNGRENISHPFTLWLILAAILVLAQNI